MFSAPSSPRRHAAQQGRLPGRPGPDGGGLGHPAVQLPRRRPLGGEPRGRPGRGGRLSGGAGRGREARRLPWYGGSFSFGSAVALRAIRTMPASPPSWAPASPSSTSSRGGPAPGASEPPPHSSWSGERDAFGPPPQLRRVHCGVMCLNHRGRGARTTAFFEGKLPELEAAIYDFASSIQDRS